MATRIETTANEIVSLAIAIFIIGLVLGMGIYIQNELAESMGGSNSIPQQITLANYASQFSMLITILVISALVMVVFGVVIPMIRRTTAGGGGVGA